MSRKYDVQPGANQVHAWKRAIAERNKAKRRGRWKRPGPAITGYVIMPPDSRSAPRAEDDHSAL